MELKHAEGMTWGQEQDRLTTGQQIARQLRSLPPLLCLSGEFLFSFLPDYLYWGSVVGSEDNVVSPSPAPHSPTDPVLQAPALWIETTAYGLLHLLLREGKAEMAERAAAWLNHQGSFRGGFRSTQVEASGDHWTGGVGGPEGTPLSPAPPPQDTVMALDALSAYWITSYTPEEKGLNVTLSSMGRSGLKFHTLQLNNHQVKGLEEQLQVNLSFA